MGQQEGHLGPGCKQAIPTIGFQYSIGREKV